MEPTRLLFIFKRRKCMELIIKVQIEDGEVVNTDVEVIDKKIIDKKKTWSQYAKFFDEFSVNWTGSAEKNRMFLKCQQQYANDILKTRGHLFLNEVYDMLGIPRTSEGQLVGWVYGGEHDNYVDFGIDDPNLNPENEGFVDGGYILLDFNVDGSIIDRI